MSAVLNMAYRDARGIIADYGSCSIRVLLRGGHVITVSNVTVADTSFDPNATLVRLFAEQERVIIRSEDIIAALVEAPRTLKGASA